MKSLGSSKSERKKIKFTLTYLQMGYQPSKYLPEVFCSLIECGSHD